MITKKILPFVSVNSKRARRNPLEDRVRLLKESGYFDEAFYLSAYPDVAAAGVCPYTHFIKYGGFEGRRPSAKFDSAYYLDEYPDVKASGVNPLVHYIQFGKSEGRHYLARESCGGRARAKADAEIRKKIEKREEPSLYVELAESLRAQGKWWQAVEVLKSAIALDANNPDWHFFLGQALEAMKRYREAAEAYGQAVMRKPGNAEWHYRMGYVYERDGHDGPASPVLAERAYKKAIELDKKLNAKRFGIGAFHQQRGLWAPAVVAYQKQLQSSSITDAEVSYRLGMAHDRCYEWRKAEQYYTHALALDIDQQYWHYRLGFVRERQGNYLGAAEAYRYAALSAKKHTPYWFYRSGYALVQVGDYVAACEALIHVQQHQGIDRDRHTSQPSEPVPASSDVSDDGDVQPSDLEMYKSSFRAESLATVVQEQLEFDCTSPDLWYKLGNAFERLNQWEPAADAYRHAIARKDNHVPEWHYRLGYVLATAGRHREACDAFLNMRILQKPYGVAEDHFNTRPGFRQSAVYTEFYNRLAIVEGVILYESFHGASMSCNPLALFIHAIERPEFQNWTHVWVINDLAKVAQKYKCMKNVVFVQRGSDLYLYYLASAKFLVNNNTFAPYFIRKADQVYLNTWHGTPIKSLGKDIKGAAFEYKNASRNFLHTTHLLSPNKHTTNCLLDRYEVRGLMAGRVVEVGYPRIDLLNKSDEDADAIKRELRIPEGKPVILYAPTYRGSSIGRSDQPGPAPELAQAKALLTKLHSLDDAAVLFRAHHMIEAVVKEEHWPVFLPPDEIDTNDLLSVVDILITDYSSVAIDFLKTGRTIMFFAHDYDEYKAERGLYFELSSLSSHVYIEADNLVGAVATMIRGGCRDPGYGREAVDQFCPHDDFMSSQRVIDSVFLGESRVCNAVEASTAGKAPRLLLYPGALIPNGITTSLRNLMTGVAGECSIWLALDPDSVANHEERMEQLDFLPDDIRVLPRVGNMIQTIEEKWVNDSCLSTNDFSNTEKEKIIAEVYHREYLRMFGSAHFDAVVNFEGYVRFWALLFAHAPSGSDNSIYLHNDMMSEHKERFPNQETVFRLYRKYKSLVSVSSETCRVNRENLAVPYDLRSSSFSHCDNFLDPNLVRELGQLSVPAEDEYIFEGDGPVFVNMARLSVEKNHRDLFFAFKRISEVAPLAKLIVLGDGPLRETLNRQISESKLDGRVVLLGRKTNPFPYLARSDCFVFSSKYEGQGLVLLEAMMLGIPVISTDFPCVHDVLQGGRLGLIVDNSVDGLVSGMSTYLSGDLRSDPFDHDVYQQTAQELFYKNVCRRVTRT